MSEPRRQVQREDWQRNKVTPHNEMGGNEGKGAKKREQDNRTNKTEMLERERQQYDMWRRVGGQTDGTSS